MRALETRAEFRGDSSLATWLNRIPPDAAVDQLRRSREDPTEDVASLGEERWQDEAVVATRA